MNVPDYLKELLLQYNEVSVPGLGAFSMVRKNATYNEKEGKFYPPYHQVKFNPQVKDDNLFIKYLADKKNILFDTASYIVEKFVSGLLEQAGQGNTAFADIGWFSKYNNELVFKPNDKLVIDPSFYGYTPIALDKLHTDKPKPVYVPPAPEVIAPKEIALDDEDTIVETPSKTKSRLSGWFIFLMVFISGLTMLFCAYLIFPTFAFKLKTSYQVMIYNKINDTLVLRKKSIPILKRKNDSAADTASTFKEPIKKSDFEVVVYSSRTFTSAQAEVRRLEHLGMNAEILTKNVTGPLLKVSIFSSANYAAADSVLELMLKSGKISKTSHIVTLQQ